MTDLDPALFLEARAQRMTDAELHDAIEVGRGRGARPRASVRLPRLALAAGALTIAAAVVGTIALRGRHADPVNITLGGPTKSARVGEFDAVRVRLLHPLGARKVEVRLRDFRGRVLVAGFGASWCRPCRSSNAALVNLDRRNHDLRLAVVKIAVNDPKARQEVILEVPTLVLAGGYRARGLPETVVIGADGATVGRIVGLVDAGARRRLDGMVDRALAAAPPAALPAWVRTQLSALAAAPALGSVPGDPTFGIAYRYLATLGLRPGRPAEIPIDAETRDLVVTGQGRYVAVPLIGKTAILVRSIGGSEGMSVTVPAMSSARPVHPFVDRRGGVVEVIGLAIDGVRRVEYLGFGPGAPSCAAEVVSNAFHCTLGRTTQDRVAWNPEAPWSAVRVTLADRSASVYLKGELSGDYQLTPRRPALPAWVATAMPIAAAAPTSDPRGIAWPNVPAGRVLIRRADTIVAITGAARGLAGWVFDAREGRLLPGPLERVGATRPVSAFRLPSAHPVVAGIASEHVARVEARAADGSLICDAATETNAFACERGGNRSPLAALVAVMDDGRRITTAP